MIDQTKIPEELKVLPNWTLWATVERNGKPTKVPFQINGDEAKSNTPDTWDSFEFAHTAYSDSTNYDGIGFMFGAEPAGFVGVDLDGCRNPETGAVDEWAKEIIKKFPTYSEVSPSQTGVKIFCKGKSPFDTGKNLKLPQFGSAGGKSAGIEIYDHLRYFAVTGLRMKGPAAVNNCQDQIDWLKGKFWPDAATGGTTGDFYGDDSVIDRARKYLTKCPPALSGSNGSAAAFKVACFLILGFGLTRDTALVLFREWNQTCQPPWSEREMGHKIDDATKQPGPRNYLRNIQPVKWSGMMVPVYEEPQRVKGHQPRKSTMVQAAESYLDLIESGGGKTISLGIPQLDEALGGGVELGEFVILAARPSHGKSMMAMQFLHYWSTVAIPTMFISEEMPAVTLGKRAMQFISSHPQGNWRDAPKTLREELKAYAEYREKIIIIESCVSVEMAVQQIDEAISEHGIKIAIVDYLQCLKSKGKDKTEQVSNASLTLRTMAHERKILIIILCHLNRQIEGRKSFTPVMADLKDSGQIEQDGDVILFLVWPWQVDNKKPPREFNIFVAKNRNRGIQKHVVRCELDAVRQTVSDPLPANYESAFDDPRSFEEQRNGEF